MKALVQRVSEASVTVDEETVGKIGPGFAVLVGVSRDDSELDADYIVNKVVNLRVFADEDGKFNLSAMDVGPTFSSSASSRCTPTPARAAVRASSGQRGRIWPSRCSI